jgi:hypothetical protein
MNKADNYQFLNKNTLNDKKGTLSVTFNLTYAIIL